MAGPAAPLAIRIVYRPLNNAGEWSTWMDVPPVDGEPQLEQARHLAKVLRRQGGWEVALLRDGKRLE